MGDAMRKKLEFYQDHLIGCAPGTHACLLDLIKKYVTARSGVLDVGTHTGALLLRLRNAGFNDLVGSDLDETRFELPEADFLKLDLNTQFAKEFGREFNLIVSTDVIEHLDSPRAFLSQLREILSDGGVIALSFPNVAFWEGRLKFLLKGELWGFGSKNYILQRHISPMTLEQTELLLQELGYEVLEMTSGGSFATTLRRIVTAPLWIPIRLIAGKKAMGECGLVVARKTVPDEDIKVPLHYKSRWAGVADRIGFE